MLKDFTSSKKPDKEAIVAAISALKAKGWDVNPYSVADEAKMSRTAIFRNPEFMEILNQAMGEQTGVFPEVPEELSNRVAQLEARNHELQTELELLRKENQDLAKSVQTSWKSGYDAGKNDALLDANSLGTTGDAQLAPKPEPKPEPEIEPEIELELNERPPVEVIVDVAPLAAALDEEALNDPFTAKLLEALTHDVSEEDIIAAVTGNPDVLLYPGAADHESLEPQPEPATGHKTHAAREAEADDESPEAADESHAAPGEPSPVHKTSGERCAPGSDQAPGSAANNFKSEELEDLLRHRFKGDTEAEAEHKEKEDPAHPGSTSATHKFVGGRAAAIAGGSGNNHDPTTNSHKIYPPEIRKAMLLLGIKSGTEMTRPLVIESWKREMSKPGVHPDTGGDTEMAIYLNTAKDALLRFVDAQAPKLGKKFGSAANRDGKRSGEAQEGTPKTTGDQASQP